MKMSEFEAILESIKSHKPGGMAYDVALKVIVSIMGPQAQGLLDSTQSVELYGRLLTLLLKPDSDVDGQLALLMTLIAQATGEMEIVGEEITEKCHSALAGSGWTEDVVATYVQYNKEMDDPNIMAKMQARANEEPGAWFYVAEIAVIEGDYELAWEAYESVPKDNPLWMKSLLALIEVHEFRSDPYESYEAAIAAFTARPSDMWLKRLTLIKRLVLSVNEHYNFSILSLSTEGSPDDLADAFIGKMRGEDDG
jgi:hypothetical protein